LIHTSFGNLAVWGIYLQNKSLKKRLYTISEASIYLGRTVWSVRELIWKGVLPSVKVGRRVHLDIYDLDAFIEKNKVCDTTDIYQ
jgi:excisionase family DNA binding protein